MEPVPIANARGIAQCSSPYDEPRVPTFEACQRQLPRHNHEHIYHPGDCRRADVADRRVDKRSSRRPREP
eukprot:6675232-Lingulodinium_polyedra.AAC.1